MRLTAEVERKIKEEEDGGRKRGRRTGQPGVEQMQE